MAVRQSPRDLLAGRITEGQAGQVSRPGSDFIGFDRIGGESFSLVLLTTLYGPFQIFQTPQNVQSAEIEALAITGEPMAVFYNNLAWRVERGGGAPPELLVSSHFIAPGSPDGLTQAGFRGSPFGSLDDPLPVKFRLNAGETLQVVLSADPSLAFVFPVTLFYRIRGVLRVTERMR